MTAPNITAKSVNLCQNQCGAFATVHYARRWLCGACANAARDAHGTRLHAPATSKAFVQPSAPLVTEYVPPPFVPLKMAEHPRMAQYRAEFASIPSLVKGE